MNLGKLTDLKSSVAETDRLNQDIFERLDLVSKRDPGYWLSRVASVKNADLYLTPGECVASGIADRIGCPIRRINLSATVSISCT